MAKPLSEYDESLFPYVDLKSMQKGIDKGEMHGKWSDIYELLLSAPAQVEQYRTMDISTAKINADALQLRANELGNLAYLIEKLSASVLENKSTEEAHCVVSFAMGYICAQAHMRPVGKPATMGAKILLKQRKPKVSVSEKQECEKALLSFMQPGRKKTIAVQMACEKLGISRSTLYERLK